MSTLSNEGIQHCCKCEAENTKLGCYHTGGPYLCDRHKPKTPPWAEPHNITWGHVWRSEIFTAGEYEEYCITCLVCGLENSIVYRDDDPQVRRWPAEPQGKCPGRSHEVQ